MSQKQRFQLRVGSFCVNHHFIEKESDLTFWMQKRPGRESSLRAKCRKCDSRGFKREKKLRTGQKRGQGERPPVKKLVTMTCSHPSWFYLPYPKVNDLILCSRCSKYRVVTLVTKSSKPMKGATKNEASI